MYESVNPFWAFISMFSISIAGGMVLYVLIYLVLGGMLACLGKFADWVLRKFGT